MKIDVIITAYNAEDTIERALQSCVNQVRKPNNVIVVDDCSQDSTYEKVRSFNDVLIHKLPVNLGCGLAKRIGIGLSQADAVMFLDSDDELDDLAIQKTEQAMLDYDADIVCMGVNQIKEDGSVKVEVDSLSVLEGEECINQFLSFKWTTVFANAKLVKKQILDRCVYSSNRYQEDTASTWRWFREAKKVVRIDYAGYDYYQRSGSLVNSKMTVSKISDSVNAYKNIMDFIMANNMYSGLACLMPIRIMSIEKDIRKIEKTDLTGFERDEISLCKLYVNQIKKQIGFLTNS